MRTSVSFTSWRVDLGRGAIEAIVAVCEVRPNPPTPCAWCAWCTARALAPAYKEVSCPTMRSTDSGCARSAFFSR